jgi:hypothetical protein
MSILMRQHLQLCGKRMERIDAPYDAFKSLLGEIAGHPQQLEFATYRLQMVANLMHEQPLPRPFCTS